jgi:hypothetical protein
MMQTRDGLANAYCEYDEHLRLGTRLSQYIRADESHGYGCHTNQKLENTSSCA